MAWVVVPAKGSSGFRIVLTGATDFIVLGPFAAGSILRRVTVSVSMEGEVAGMSTTFNMAVVGGPDPSVANFDSGHNLVEVSDRAIASAPAVSCTAIQSLFAVWEFFPGWVFATGARWLLGRAVVVSAAASAHFFISTDVVRVVRVGDASGALVA